MKYILSFFCLFVFGNLNAQCNADSIYASFSTCLASFFRKEFKQVDSSFHFFYGYRYNPYMGVVSHDLGRGIYFLNLNCDTVQHLFDTSGVHLYREMSFDEFVNYSITPKSEYKEGVLYKNVGVKVFVDCPYENWVHFYFDRILNKKKCILTPFVDVLRYSNTGVVHDRSVLVCVYKNNKFSVSKKILISTSVLYK